MYFAETLLTEDLAPLRRRLLFHPLWERIEAGTLPKERLRLFALQDWWLVREAYRLDALAIANTPDLEVQELLIGKLQAKVGGYRLLHIFGEALGLTRQDFEAVEPLAGCMALTNFFYWELAYGQPEEKLAAVSASEDIFIAICLRIAPALMRNYSLSAEQVAFFTVHEEIAAHVQPVDERILQRYNRPEQRRRITRAIRLSHEFEAMFYDTII
ncbi:MAG: iron-containing redox enzyme family protein [Ktedonobacteraceae bacterium]|nr:iron-containing redox enzyme family protein [Ktedonobacteraceae bacterium]